MEKETMKSLTAGDTLVYNDGRDGHRAVKATVLSNSDSRVLVQFEDRFTTTSIKHDDAGWTEHLTKEGRI